MKSSPAACSPDNNAVVFASAGTGKTWLLVTRLLHLLMAEIPPDTIVAITFTRKAAAEMQTRLFERLFQFMVLDDELLAASLVNQGIDASAASMRQARGLYEHMINSESPLRVTTFHAFCNEILNRFPVEAGVPPGFELLETSSLLEQEAYDALFAEATADPDGELAWALDILLRENGNTTTMRAILDEFMQHRADWWAFTRFQDHPVDFASSRLAAQLQIDVSRDPYPDFLDCNTLGVLQEFMALLNQHPTRQNQKASEAISITLNLEESMTRRISSVKNAFLTKQGNPLSRKHTRTLDNVLGNEGALRYVEIHQIICDRIGALQEVERRVLTYTTSRAWFIAGMRLLEHYQRIKNEQRVLDFNDLESRVYDLLTHSNNALWIQYKLDQRIDHLLIDEFQDTNPTQWRMMLPLLNELAAGHHEHKRSVFLVGDSKQSIYRFRRANPHLLVTAHNWLATHLDAKEYALDISWRSSPAIINFINKIFSCEPLKNHISSFQEHRTHHCDLWGKVEVLPLIYINDSDEPVSTSNLRNPLDTPRMIAEDLRHYEEGILIAHRIRDLMHNNTLIGQNNDVRALTYNDIIILARNRTHMTAYEKALRDNQIPYQSTGRTTLLDSLEVRDVVALLETLIAPYNNLSLATVLRSPLFDCGDDDLMLVASHKQQDAAPGKNKMPWMERITEMMPKLADGSSLKRAGYWLDKWRQLVGELPVHDLLDRIYSEGNVITRYQAAFPDHLQQRVVANLSRFIELALEIDSGRYPSLPMFLSRLRSLRQYTRDGLDEPPASGGENVRIMTIHAAKGLEAAVVFLADTASSTTRNRGYSAMITWPDEADKPDNFFLAGNKSAMDHWSTTLSDASEQETLQEEANLLYVAISRAKQLLYISGCAPARGKITGWFGMLAENLADARRQVGNDGFTLEWGRPPQQATIAPRKINHKTAQPDSRLTRPFLQSQFATEYGIAPSRITGDAETPEQASNDNDDDYGKLRGNIIHRLLSLATTQKTMPEKVLLQQVAGEFTLDCDDSLLRGWWQEVQQLIHLPALKAYFDQSFYITAYNEVPIQYYLHDHFIHGFIDRLIVRNDEIVVIDYKTHRNVTQANLSMLAKPYNEQIRSYAEGVQKIWPDKAVRPYLLFTSCAALYNMDAVISPGLSD